VEQQVQVDQQTSLPADIESILQPPAPQATPPAEQQPVIATPQPAAPLPPVEPHVPLHVLIEERRERQAAQAQLRQLLEAQQRSSQPQPTPIDPVADPEGAFRAVAEAIQADRQQMQQMAVHQRANTSELLAKGKYGAQAVEAAREAAVKAGLGNHFLTQNDPYESVMEWQRGQTAAKDIGDPAAYREKIKQEILAELRGQPKPGAPQVLPPSLSTATRADGSAPVVADSADFFRDMLKKR
jgi:hypothetical protein